MNSHETFISDEAREKLERELPDEYQVVFPAHCSIARRITILLSLGLIGILWFLMASPLILRMEGPITTEIIFGSGVAVLLGAAITFICIVKNAEAFLDYEVLAIGQGSIVVVRKFMMYKRVRWAKFRIDDLKMIDFQNGLGALKHAKIGCFAKNLPFKDIKDVSKAILALPAEPLTVSGDASERA